MPEHNTNRKGEEHYSRPYSRGAHLFFPQVPEFAGKEAVKEAQKCDQKAGEPEGSIALWSGKLNPKADTVRGRQKNRVVSSGFDSAPADRLIYWESTLLRGVDCPCLIADHGSG